VQNQISGMKQDLQTIIGSMHDHFRVCLRTPSYIRCCVRSRFCIRWR